MPKRTALKKTAKTNKNMSLDERVDTFHKIISFDKEVSMVADVLKSYDPDYEQVQPNSMIFKEARNKFITADNRQIGSMIELVSALNEMPDHVFKQHVNQFKHDFARWAKDNFGEEFGEKLKNSKTKKTIQEFIARTMHEQINVIGK